MRSRDAAAVALQIGRPLRSEVRVVCRCRFGLPVVFESPPRLGRGEPFPTRLWLSCPAAAKRVAWLEAAGGTRRAQALVDADPKTRRSLDRAHARYAAERDHELPDDSGPRPSGGVGGERTTIKCLHAHYADHLANHDNPVGRWTAAQLEPFRCATPCLAPETRGEVQKNPAFRVEPADSVLDVSHHPT